jgi:hypothetical protein
MVVFVSGWWCGVSGVVSWVVVFVVKCGGGD